MTSYFWLSIQDQPDIEFPVVIVTLAEPGAAPAEIETQATRHIEAAIRTIRGVDSITSTIYDGGSRTMIMFDIGTNINAAMHDVREAVRSLRTTLPEDVKEPMVSKAETTTDPIAYFAVEADDTQPEELTHFIDYTLRQRILALPGAAGLDCWGCRSRQIEVALDPYKLAMTGISADMVDAAISRVNTDFSGGKAEIAGQREIIRVLGDAQSTSILAELTIPAGKGRTVRLKDIASIRDGPKQASSIAQFNGRRVVTVGLLRTRGASDLALFDEAVKEFNQISAEYNGHIRFHPLWTNVTYTRNQFNSAMSSLIEGSFFSVLAVYIFLRNWRSTIISALSIPLSIIPTFWVMWLLDLTLNTMSMLALALVSGVLVDDAIVEIENFDRHVRTGKSPFQAALDATAEIGPAVIGTTFSIVAIFLPVAFLPGIPGQFFRNFGLTISIAVLFSLLVARLITPVLCAYVMPPNGVTGPERDFLARRYALFLNWMLGNMTSSIARRRIHGKWSGQRTKAMSVDRKTQIVLAGSAGLVITIALLISTPAQFFPDIDSDFSRIKIEAPPGMQLDDIVAATHEIASSLKNDPEVANVLEQSDENGGEIFLFLLANRPRTSLEYERAASRHLWEFPDVHAAFVPQNAVGSGLSSGRAISVMLSGSDPVLLQQTADRVAADMANLPELSAPRLITDRQRPELLIRPDPSIASHLGVTTQQLAQLVRTALQDRDEREHSWMALGGRQIPVVVQLPRNHRTSLDTITGLRAPLPDGASVPLSRVAGVGLASSPAVIERFDQTRRIFIGADVAPGHTKASALAALDQLTTLKNLPVGISSRPSGESRFLADLSRDFAMYLAGGIISVFLVLVLIYRSFLLPLINLLAALLSPLGGLLMLRIAGFPMSLPTYIGMLMLLGIVAKNTILLIDLALVLQAKGASSAQAITEAGQARIRPILMTSLAMIAGMMPTAMSLGGDGGWRTPMGIVVIGGLSISTLLTLALVPAAYCLVSDCELAVARRLRRLTLQRSDDITA